MREPLCKTLKRMDRRPGATGGTFTDLEVDAFYQHREDLADQTRPLTYKEAGFVFGYTYDSIRVLVSRKAVLPIRVNGRPRLTHAEMFRYIGNKRKSGRPRLTERIAA